MEILKHIIFQFNNQIKWLIVGVTFVAPQLAFCQNNLIFNSSCELFDTCPDNSSQLNRSTGWWNFDSFGSVDYLNTCSENPFTDIPSTIGIQLPKDGNAYLHSVMFTSQNPNGFLTWMGNAIGYIHFREPIGGTFVRALNPVPHKMEFYVSFSKTGFDDSMGGGDGRIATNAFDLLLLNDKLGVYNSVSPYINEASIINLNSSNIVLNDTTEWMKVSACFIPNGGENYFVVGTLRDTSQIQRDFSGNSNSNTFVASYFFDDFSLVECDTCCLGQFTFEDHINVSSNPGGQNNPTVFTVVLNSNTSAELTIYDSAGRLVANRSFTEMVSNYTLPIDLATGIYHYSFHTSNGIEQNGKVLVSAF